LSCQSKPLFIIVITSGLKPARDLLFDLQPTEARLSGPEGSKPRSGDMGFSRGRKPPVFAGKKTPGSVAAHPNALSGSMLSPEPLAALLTIPGQRVLNHRQSPFRRLNLIHLNRLAFQLLIV
jgi:hypothetical protein